MNSMFGGTGQGATRAGGTNNSTGMLKNKIPKGYREGRLQNFTPEQNNLFQHMFSQVSPDSYLSRLAAGDQDLFNEIESPELQQFSGELGGIASRFSQGGGGQGALSSRRSSGFQNATNNAASHFAQQLQAQRQGLQRQAMQDLHSMSRELLTQQPYNRFLTKKDRPSPEQEQDEGFNWWGLAGGALGGLAGFLSPVPGGLAAGVGLGYNAGSGLSGKKGNSNISDAIKFGQTFTGNDVIQPGSLSSGGSMIY